MTAMQGVGVEQQQVEERNDAAFYTSFTVAFWLPEMIRRRRDGFCVCLLQFYCFPSATRIYACGVSTMC